MKSDALKKQSHLLLWVSVALLLGGCAATRPAPVVHRTSPGPAPVATAPQPAPVVPATEGHPADSGRVADAGTAGDEGQGDEGDAEVTPIYQGAINAPGKFGAPQDPNLKVGPQGMKRPYGTPKPTVVAQASSNAGLSVQGTAAAGATGAAGAKGAGAVASAKDAGKDAAKDAKDAKDAGKDAQAAKAPPVPSATRNFDGVRFSWPVAGRVVQPFDGVSNKGLLLSGKVGDAVLAAADGRVIFSGQGPRGYGNLVIIKHSNEMLSVYAHNRSLAVKEGQQVTRGQKIAELGDAGNGQPALHFEVRQGGKPVDPAGVLPKR
mgnify:FL=1